MEAGKTFKEILRELEKKVPDLKLLKEFILLNEETIRETEERAKKHQEIFEKAFNTSPDAININRLSDGLFVAVNEGFTRITGFSAEDTIGKTSLEIDIWADKDKRTELVRLLQKSGKVENFETKFRMKGGGLIYGLMSATLIEIGGVPHILSFTRDITKIKDTELQLESERSLLRTLIDNMPDRIYAKDRESKFIICNKALVKRMGKTDDSEIIGKSDLELLPEELAKQYYSNEQEIIKSGKPLINHEETMGTIAGTKRWSLTTKVPVLDSEGNIKGIVGIGKDITDRKKKEIESQVLYEISRGIASTGNLDEFLTLVHQTLSKVVYAENCFVALYKADEQLFSFPLFVDKFDVPPPPQAMHKSCTAFVFKTGKPLLLNQAVFEILQETGDVELVGSSSPSWIGIPLRIPSKVIGVLVLQHYEEENVYSIDDVDFLLTVGSQIAVAIDRKRYEEEIRLKNELLQMINSEKDKLFSIIAHDLRGPLSSFVSATQMITEEIQEMSLEEIRELTQIMKKEASSVYALLENLLEWSRLKRGAIDFRRERINLKDRLNNSIELLRELSHRKGINVNNNVSSEITISADVRMFDSLIRNLLSNALKFTPSGGEINLYASKAQNEVVEVLVSDNGIGMSPEIISKIFSIEGKTGRPGTDGEPSSGLGLIVCREFVEKHNGKLWVESEVGKGSIFHFTIPE